MTAPRSLQHEYELYVEREIELYKDTLSRSALLSIGDEAVARLREQAQTTLTERVRGCVCDLGQWSPDVALRAVVCTPAAFTGLTPSERGEAIAVLQSATL